MNSSRKPRADSIPTLINSITAMLPDIKTLRESPEAKALLSIGRGGASSAAENTAKAKAFTKRAESMGLAGSAWFLMDPRKHIHHSLMLTLLHTSHCQGAVQELVRSGASAWPSAVKSLYPEGVEIIFAQPRDLADYAMGSDKHPVSACRACLVSSLSGLGEITPGLAEQFMKCLANAYARQVASSDSASLGVLGPGDKKAKACAQTIAAHADALIEASRVHAPTCLDSIRAIVSDAQARLAAKARSDEAPFDPEALRKSLIPAHKARLRSFCMLLDQCQDDLDLANLAIDSTAWLSGNPQALCVRVVRSGSSVLHSAVQAAAPSALARIEALGGNIWVAAAQAGNANACLWVASLLSVHWSTDAMGTPAATRSRAQACLPILARLLAYGAYLDGASDPLARATQRVDEALVQAQAAHPARHIHRVSSEILQSLRSCVEAIELEELLHRHRSGNGGGSEAKCDLVKKRGRL